MVEEDKQCEFIPSTSIRYRSEKNFITLRYVTRWDDDDTAMLDRRKLFWIFLALIRSIYKQHHEEAGEIDE